MKFYIIKTLRLFPSFFAIGIALFAYQALFSDQAFAAGRFCFMGICITDWSTGGFTAIDKNKRDGKWSDWGTCTPITALGVMGEKTRSCIGQMNGGKDCSGLDGGNASMNCTMPDGDIDGIRDDKDTCPNSYYASGNGCPRVSSKSFTFDDGGTTKEIYYGWSTAVNMKWSIGYTYINGIASSDEDKYWIEMTNNPINDQIRTYRYGGSVTNLYASTTTTYILTLHGPGFDEEIGRVTANNPDTDGDGISRHADRCPDLYGYSDNDGCPNNIFSSWAKTDGSAPNGTYCYNTRSANQPLNLSISNGKIAGDGLVWKSGCQTANGSRNEYEAALNMDILAWTCMKSTLRIATEEYPSVGTCSKSRLSCVDIAILCNWQDVNDSNIKSNCGVAGENGYRARKIECY